MDLIMENMYSADNVSFVAIVIRIRIDNNGQTIKASDISIKKGKSLRVHSYRNASRVRDNVRGKCYKNPITDTVAEYNL